MGPCVAEGFSGERLKQWVEKMDFSSLLIRGQGRVSTALGTIFSCSNQENILSCSFDYHNSSFCVSKITTTVLLFIVLFKLFSLQGISIKRSKDITKELSFADSLLKWLQQLELSKAEDWPVELSYQSYFYS